MSVLWEPTDDARAADRHLSARQALLRRPVGLVGFMGVGKTSVGRELAELLGRPFVDTDTMIVEGAGRSIPEIFATDGEKRFRDLEYDAVASALDGPPRVIALGGGAFSQPRTAAMLLDRAIVVHLYTPWNVIVTLLERLSAKRPLIRDREPWQVQELFLARGESYRRAHLRVVIPRHTAAESAQIVAELLQHPDTDRQMLDDA
ncbi:MAG: shikimate kinase [Chloroflexota bacterium]|nr:shikimate kinase [Chloroflexota bacterium]